MAGRARAVLLTFGVILGIFLVFFTAVLALLGYLEGGEILSFPGERVALVEVEGIILDADDVVRQLKEHLENSAVKAVVIRINSPGGVVAPTQEIYDALGRLRDEGKPVVASLGSVAASGGYYIASAADQIVANPGTLTGSIGVIMQLTNLEGLLKKVGLRYEIVKSGKYKDIGSFSRPMTNEERAILQSLMDDVHDQFVEAVANGRGLDRTVVLSLADGRIFSGRQAKELNLVDELGGREEAIQAAASLAGITGKPKLLFPRRRFSITDWVQERFGGRSFLFPASLPPFKTPLYLMD
ncbi:MAG: signal peptide peptidase SppA [Candidatus Rokubacteria bacterium]|nr:signal peptide peptidase SppA [Candidatus Rokubacteria bacterium]